MSNAFAKNLRRSQTEAERTLWSKLRNRQLGGFKFKRQVPKGPYVVDFYCAEAHLVIELDGGQHADEEAVAHDAKRTSFLQESGFRVLRFWNSDIAEGIEGVLETIWAKLQEPPLPDRTAHSLSPSGRGLGGRKGACGMTDE
ncbi:endonuclease domain-containing protein [Hyphococcus luteus]|uniref:DUF559 domain-containing protein n=1 Tax=Hyphococcus luteus TaxID=2058213 RepID=A0A2S7JZX1_9PROT|nr:endonuclease domain-containing protein [Marinicaulis flavus]PQA85766.1 hypothetical protein CW354_21385 [Marinicaulis flavus]